MRIRKVAPSNALAVVLLLGLGACSKKNEINQDNSGGGTIGPAGGIVEGPAACGEVRIPAGALTEDTAIGIAVAGPGQYPPLPAGWDVSGSVCAFTPHGLDFLTAAIVGMPAGSGTTLLKAEESGSWAPIASQSNADMLEASVTGFSFFAAASEGGPGDGGTVACSGRAPLASAPTGTISGLSGSINATGPYPAVDLATMLDARAELDTTSRTLKLVFTPYEGACGHLMNGLDKPGAFRAEVQIRDMAGGPITTDVYAVEDVTVQQLGFAASQAVGACTPPTSGGPGAPPDATTALTITALDATHVAGVFDFTPLNGTRLQGTFDVPLCEPLPNLDPPLCCIP